MKIRYGVSKRVRKPHRKSKIITKNHGMDIPEAKSMDDRDIIYEAIKDKHPGWSVAGWCEDIPKNKKVDIFNGKA